MIKNLWTNDDEQTFFHKINIIVLDIDNMFFDLSLRNCVSSVVIAYFDIIAHNDC